VAGASSSVPSARYETKANRKKHEGSLLTVFSDVGSTPTASTILSCLFTASYQVREYNVCNTRYTLGMITVFRRHVKGCRFAIRGRSYRHCTCPLAAEGRLHGKLIRRSLDVRGWEAAQKIVRSWELGEKNDIPTVAVAMKRMIADMKSRRLSSETIAKFELLARELEGFGRVDRVVPDELAKLRETWKLKPSTAAKKLERLRSFFKFCVERGWITQNPARGLRPPKEIDIAVKPFEPAELEKIQWSIPLFPTKGIYGEANRERISAFIAVLRLTGLRIRDVVQLKRSAVAENYITLRTQKNGKPVKLPLHPDINLSSLKGEYFFWSGEGNPKSCVGDWQRTLRRLGEVAGVHIHAHRFRHTFATDLLSKGVPVSEVAAILGNSPRIVEKHYSQWISTRQTAIDAAVKLVWV
jgi:integrase